MADRDNQDPKLFGQTPWQTIGPFFHVGLPWKGGADLVGNNPDGARPDLSLEGHDRLPTPQPRGPVAGEVVIVTGRILDGEAKPVSDALVEIWQANAAGRYHSPDDNRDDIALDEDFIGFGRCATDRDGHYRFRTIKPGRVPGPGNQLQASHIAMSIMGRGMLRRLVTRFYFADDENLSLDPILDLVPPERRNTLVARFMGENPAVYWLDVMLGGPTETVFFDV